MRYRLAGVVGACLLLVSCSAPAPTEVEDAQGAALTPDDSESSGPRKASKSDRAKAKTKEEASSGNEEGSKEAGGGGTEGGSTQTGDASASGFALPDEGAYVYAQEGWEEFCQASSCDRDDLPSQQKVTLDHGQRTASAATFQTHAEGGSRTQTITYRVTREEVAIERLEGSVSYGGVTMGQEMVPDPRILSAVFPLQVGKSWSGSWQDRNDEMDGSYAFEVVGREQMAAAGKTYDAFVIDVDMTFTGEYRGSNVMRLWVDPQELSILSTRGRLEIASSFGTYRTRFTTFLSSAP